MQLLPSFHQKCLKGLSTKMNVAGDWVWEKHAGKNRIFSVLSFTVLLQCVACIFRLI